MNHIVTAKQAHLVKKGDWVMTPTGPKQVRDRSRTKTGRLMFTYGQYTDMRFTRERTDLVYVAAAPVEEQGS